MQATHNYQEQGDEIENTSTASSGVTISFEVVIYALLILFSLAIRVADLDIVPITGIETHNALAAYRAGYAEAAGPDLISDSPVQFWLQQFALALISGDEGGARIFTALAGVALGVLPLLFRDVLGRMRAFLMALVLSLSPVLLVASRSSSGVIWTLLFAGIGVWALWQYWENREKTPYAVTAFGMFGAMLLLTEPGGIVFALILLVAGGVTLILTSISAPDDDSPDQFMATLRDFVNGLPWQAGLITAILTVFIVSTGMMLQPDRLSMVGAVVEGFLNGFIESPDGTPTFFPLIVALFYEPWMWILGGIGAYVIVRGRQMDFVERFFMVWVVTAIFAAIVYQGATAAHALWLIVPLVGLASHLANEALQQETGTIVWINDFFQSEAEYVRSMGWARWVIAITTFALTTMFILHLTIIARGFLNVPGGTFGGLVNRLGERVLPFSLIANSLIWLIITALFIVVGFFLAASIWGNRFTLRTMTIGVFGYALMIGVATGWQTAVVNANDPVELWHIETTNTDAELLRETLLEIAQRETLGEPAVPVVAVVPDDGIIAWQLRDFTELTYADDPSTARLAQVAILSGDVPEIDLGGSYVGQPFVITRTWSSAGSLEGFDFLPWWLTRDVRVNPFNGDVITLWVRQDIYDSEPFQSAGNGVG